jgi:hypothetical protein
MRYYDVQKNWSRKIKPHLANETVQAILVKDFNRFTYGRWRKPFLPGMTPHEFESCDWWLDHRGRMPEYWNYVKHAACHHLVNFNRRLAELSEPKRDWRIVTSQAHSTVWDGAETLFDMQFLALGVDPDEAWALARDNGRVLPVGKNLVVHFAEHWQIEKDTAA